MQIYSVMRYGNDEVGPDGDDTEFIVLAATVDEAATIVDMELKKLPHRKVSTFCHAVSLIGKSYSAFNKSLILSGPFITGNSRCDVGIPTENIWKRCEGTGKGEWIPFDEY